MRQAKLVSQIYRYFMVATLVCLAAVSVYLTTAIKHIYLERITDELAVRAELAADTLAPAGILPAADSVDSRCKELGKISGTRYTVILPNGKVIGDSRKPPAELDNHRTRPEVIQALSGTSGSAVRFSNTLGRNLVYVAIPIKHNNTPVAVMRAAIPVDTVTIAMRVIRTQILASLALAAVLFALLGFFISRLVTRPLDNVRAAAVKLADGDLCARAPVEGSYEIATLAGTLNDVATQLQSRITTIKTQQEELKAVFAGMHEGVIALDSQMRIIHINKSARRWLEIKKERCEGKLLSEASNRTGFIQLAKELINAQSPAGREFSISYSDGKERWFMITAAAFDHLTKSGTVLVMNNITAIKQLEIMRKNFVADVSHELKTPLTAICGAVETIAASQEWRDSSGYRFINMLERHSARMQSLIEDLLTLASIEYDSERGAVRLTPMPLAGIISRIAALYRPAAGEHNITIEIDADTSICAAVNEPLLEQAVGNLLNNAIKYSGDGTAVTLRLRGGNADCSICVADNGKGIAAEHLPYLFQRFYRVDKARSRQAGGTGLGLAIAKHIALAHNGRISVKSRPGRGTLFTITLPRIPCPPQS